MKKCFLIICIYFVFFLTSCNNNSDINLGESQTETNETLYNEITESTSEKETEEYITVFISGCVNNPDVYTLKKGAIVKDALDMAGGFSESACRDYVNLAKELDGGEHIIIPDIEAVKNSEVLVLEEEKPGNSLVNINTASKEELMNLPGIGERKAEAIIEYRDNSRFTSIEDIMNISGIKEAAFNKIKDKICIN